jgi:hypothetical protein
MEKSPGNFKNKGISLATGSSFPAGHDKSLLFVELSPGALTGIFLKKLKKKIDRIRNPL